MSLGTLEPGQYTYSLQLKSGSISTSFIADYLGTQFYASTSSITSGSKTVDISFQLSQRAYGVGLVVIQAPGDGNISLSYSAANTGNVTSSSSRGMKLGFDVDIIVLLSLMCLAVTL